MIKEYRYGGKVVLVKNGHELYTPLGIDRLEKLVEGVPAKVKIDMATKAPYLLRAMQIYGLNPATYVSNADIVDAVVNSDAASPAELQKNNANLWNLAQQRGLIGKIFPELKPAV